MVEIASLAFVGGWRVKVASRNAGWSQRVVAANTAVSTVVLDGTSGALLDIEGAGQSRWTLSIEHDDGSSGWQPRWLRPTSSTFGTRFQLSIGSEDNTSPNSDRDFNDSSIRVDKLGMVAQAVPPFAVPPHTLQTTAWSGTPVSGGCDLATLERPRSQLRGSLDGKEIDLCAVWRDPACCCAGRGPGHSGGEEALSDLTVLLSMTAGAAWVNTHALGSNTTGLEQVPFHSRRD